MTDEPVDQVAEPTPPTPPEPEPDPPERFTKLEQEVRDLKARQEAAEALRKRDEQTGAPEPPKPLKEPRTVADWWFGRSRG